ncbi:anthranilate synthase component I [Anaerocolumna sedimenticola]|uniref:Anthranilate synthase component 1 n=1 Tax=Anaerocolumna sedimenticola TaxID=2696063 RepID=A0A6P1TNW9_9FIRM|nr:anthranilate synthase component I [Anaerocolumna sedimenticola]QHQ61872.1 anthranilate synthase component I [Anaerocolumna sedimenticola]
MNASYEKMQQYETDYNLIPVCKEIFADIITPIILLRKLAQVDRNYYLLESVEGGERWGRYSFLGFNPLLHLTCENGEVTVKSGEIVTKTTEDPMTVLRGLLNKYKSPHIDGLPPFTGGFVGYFSYEMIGYAEPKLKIKTNNFKDYDLMLFDKVIAFDHLRQKISIVVNYKSEDKELGYHAALLEIEKIIHLINDPAPLQTLKADTAPQFTCNISKETYCEMVEKTKKYIREGDIFQAVISRRFEADYNSSLLNTYRVLRTTNPSPYMYFIQCEDVQITGASPETMIKLVDGKLTTFPVAGTRPRGKTTDDDRELEKELLADEKELSEHNMLVDLARNDVGKIAKYGSVMVEEYMKIHRFSKVMHIASVVTGQIEKSKDSCDTVAALLPAGTLSGAPKFRACEIIDELEPTPRGIYGGAIGYLDFSGNLDVCIAIRTAVKKGNKVYVQAGAGIVADSVPEKEYEECANKAGAVMEAIKKACEVEL